MSTTVSASAARPTTTLTVPVPGGDTDTWGDTLNDDSLKGLLAGVLWASRTSELAVSQATHGFSVGDAVRHDGTDWVEALADTAPHAVTAGLVVSVADANTFTVAFAGTVTGLSGLTGGSVYYLQDAGGLGATAGTVEVPVLLATGATGGVMLTIGAAASSGASGDVVGPGSSTDANLAAFDGTTGKLLKDAGVAASAFATAAQGGLADSAIQPGDDAATLGSGAATATHVLTADGLGGTAFAAVPGGGGGATAFTGLTDTPSAFTGAGGKNVTVKGDETGLEFTAAPTAGVSINAQTGTTYTLVLTDADKLVTLDNGSAITLTVPTNASVAFPVGTVIALAQLGAGAVSIAGATGVTINGATPGSEALAAQYGTASLTKLATDTWLASGGLA